MLQLTVLALYYWEKDPALKEKLKELIFQKFPAFLDKFEEQVKRNGGYFVGGKFVVVPLWADFVWIGYSDILTSIVGGDPNKDHPELKKLVEKVCALPNVETYIAK